MQKCMCVYIYTVKKNVLTAPASPEVLCMMKIWQCELTAVCCSFVVLLPRFNAENVDFPPNICLQKRTRITTKTNKQHINRTFCICFVYLIPATIIYLFKNSTHHQPISKQGLESTA